jgi:hypothetical protein
MTSFQSFVKDVDDYRIRLKQEGANLTGVDQLNLADAETPDEEDEQGGGTLLVCFRFSANSWGGPRYCM